jgi:hypothetical protein
MRPQRTLRWRIFAGQLNAEIAEKEIYSCYSCNSWLNVLMSAFDGFCLTDLLKDERGRHAEET